MKHKKLSKIFGLFHKQKCCHCPYDSEKSTLKQLNMSTMVTPKRYYFVCTECGESFEFIKDANGELMLYHEE